MPRRRQLDLPAAAVEQLRAQLLLQAPDALAQRRLLHTQALGGPPEVTFFTYRQETLQVPHDVHAATISTRVSADRRVDIGRNGTRRLEYHP
ncbi:hypothetical protein GCM10009782_44170 [Glycomyces algeriensis]